MATTEESLTYEAILEKDGVKVSKSPWGADDEIGRLELGHARVAEGDPRAARRHQGLRPLRRLLHRHAVLVGRGRPEVRHVDDAHAAGLRERQPLRRRRPRCTRSTATAATRSPMYTHCGTHMDTLNHLGYFGCFWNGWTAEKHLGSRHWMVGGTEKYPKIIARGVLLDIAGLHGVDCLPDSYEVTADDLKKAAQRAGRRAAPRRRRLPAHGPDDRLAGLRRLPPEPARDRARGRALPLRGGRRDVHRRRHDRPRGAPLRGRGVPAGALLHVRDGRRPDHGGRLDGGDRGREAVRVRLHRRAAEADRARPGAPFRPIAVPLRG